MSTEAHYLLCCFKHSCVCTHSFLFVCAVGIFIENFYVEHTQVESNCGLCLFQIEDGLQGRNASELKRLVSSTTFSGVCCFPGRTDKINFTGIHSIPVSHDYKL